MSTNTDRLVRDVIFRLRVVRFGRWSYRLLLAAAVVAALILACTRLLGLWPEMISPALLAALPILAVAAALTCVRSGGRASAAKTIDDRLGAKDLFLTAALLESCPAEYAPLVAQQAQERAGEARAASIVPFRGWSRAGRVVGAWMLIVIAMIALPQLDPFGLQKQRQQLIAQKKDLLDQQKLAAERAAVLKAKPLSADLSEEVKRSLDQLKQTFNSIKPNDPKANLAKLNTQQKFIGDKWRDASKQKVNDSASSGQRFGSGLGSQQRQWKQELAGGNARSVQQQIREVRDMAQKLADAKNDSEKQQIKSEMEKKLQDLAEFANSNLSNSAAGSALSRAMSQLQMEGMEGLSSEALEALDSTLEMSELELEAMAQNMRDLAALEEALKAIQMAKQLNSMQPFDGEATSQCQSMGDYMQQYEQWLKECQANGDGQACSTCGGAGCSACGGTGLANGGAGRGRGVIGGAGIGRGGIAPEDPTVNAGFVPEKSRSALTAGKILLQIKTQQLADAGKAEVDYKENLQQVQQGVSESILQEQIPPGYHDAIKKYFDTVTIEAAP